MTETYTVHNLKSYNKPTMSDTCVGLCYFNPIGYKNLTENLNIIIDTYKKSNIPYFIIELVYPHQQPQIPDATKTVYANTVLFSKENLWNILEKSIPDQYSKILFIDADVKFTNPDWFNLSSEKLNQCDIIQPMDVVFRDLKDKYQDYIEIDVDSCSYTVTHMIETTGKANAAQHHPGYAIGINREIYHKIHGIFEYGIYGHGDSLFWMAVSNFHSDNTQDFLCYRKNIAKMFYNYKINILNLNYDLKVGSVYDNMSIHLFHGSLKNRAYKDRTKYVKENRDLDKFYYNNDGVLEMNDNSVYEYLLSRKEDSDE